MIIFRSLLIFVIAGIFLGSCKKDPVLTDSSASLAFSIDTLMFDTVFTTVGSITKKFKVYNPNNQRVIISSIRLEKGSSSKFRLNVDGIPGKELTDIEILEKDSLFVFVEVTLGENSANNPLIITEKILFTLNGNQQEVNLVAWGQDAIYYTPDTRIEGLPPFKVIAEENVTTTWKKDKPIVIYGYAVVDSLATLVIEPGTKIYFHNNGGLWIYKGGCLKVNGTLEEPVIFQGDRLEYSYKDIPGQWDRIWINESAKESEINYAIIKNGYIGIQAEILNTKTGNKLRLKNTIIKNMSGAGILSRFYDITAENTVIADCKDYVLALTLGGNYDFTHCTFANYYKYASRQTPLLAITNSNELQAFDLNASFKNCIIYGNTDNEIKLDPNPAAAFNYTFDHCILKIDPATNTNTTNYINIVKNPSLSSDTSLFRDYHNGNFELSDFSPAIDLGSSVYGALVPFDLNKVSRTANPPDLGAYERK